MRRLYVFLTCLSLSTAVAAQNLDDIILKADSEMSSLVADFTASADDSVRAYNDFAEKLRKEYEEFRQEAKERWGDSTYVESTNKLWVEYGDDDTRTSVDFESGEVLVEALVDDEASEDIISALLSKAVDRLLSSKGSVLGFRSAEIPDAEVTETPVMDDMIDLSRYAHASSSEGDSRRTALLNKGKVLDLSRSQTGRTISKDSDTMAEMLKRRQEESKSISELIVHTEPHSETLVSTSVGPKKVISIKMELVEDHIPKRAERFKNIIEKQSSRFGVAAPLIYAVIEQESAFNPMAKSHVPAYGLMQLVPSSGGRDAYRYVYKQDKAPTPSFLYEPENNIELGVAYLHILMSTSFAKVSDPQCRMLCAIAAYNTGAGNVSRAMTGERNVVKAVPKINLMDYDALFKHLHNNLPHAETRDYIKKVTSKMQKYTKDVVAPATY